METVVLKATKRKITGKKVKNLRREGKLLAVMYGRNQESVPITLDRREAARSIYDLTPSSLLTLEVDGKKHTVLVQEKQRDFIKNILLHVDFLVVSMKERIRANVNIELTGSAPATRDFNGIVIQNTHSLLVECLPGDLPPKFEVDISNLENIGDNILVQDIVSSDKITIFDDPETLVVTITHVTQFLEEELEVEEVEVVDEDAQEEPEVVDKGKKEEEEE